MKNNFLAKEYSRMILSMFLIVSFVLSGTSGLLLERVDASTPLPTTIFYSDFEANTFGDWDDNTGSWHNNSSGAIQCGQKKAFVTANTSNAYISKATSTVGYSDINLEFYYRVEDELEHGDVVEVQWFNGTNWETLHSLTGSGPTIWTKATISFPLGAENQGSFAFRFLANLSTDNDQQQGQKKDEFWLDCVRLTGTAVDSDPITGSLIVTKVVNSSYGGTAEVGDFTLNVGDTEVISGKSNDFEAGNYQITEFGPEGYEATYSGNCDSQGNIIIEADGNYTCTITNNDIAAQLTVYKFVDGGDLDSSDFEIFVAGPNHYGAKFNGSESGTTLQNLSAGDYQISESEEDNYYGVFSGDCDQNEQVTLNIGDDKSCTIMNYYSEDELAYIRIKKETNDSETNQKFSFTVSGGNNFLWETELEHGEGKSSVALNSGTYSVFEDDESLPEGWELESVDCELIYEDEILLSDINPENIILNEGDTVRCTFTNTYTDHEPEPKGEITVKKEFENLPNDLLPEYPSFGFMVNDNGPYYFIENPVTVNIPYGDYEVVEYETGENWEVSYSEGCEGTLKKETIEADCIITNTYIEQEEPECSDVIVVSNEEDDVYEVESFENGFSDLIGKAVNTFTHNNWTSLTDAIWIWKTEYVENPEIDETYGFQKEFDIHGTVSLATLWVAADNSYKVWINDCFYGEDLTEFNFASADEYSVDSTCLLDEGNVIKFKVNNLAGDSNPENNPAGLLYRLEIERDTCYELVYGCTDPEAINYNPEANKDDDSCEYSEPEPENGQEPSGGSSGHFNPSFQQGVPEQVLGEAIDLECGMYLFEHIKFGVSNNPEEVRKLQTFLNEHMGMNLPVNGFYGELTRQAVNAFQLRYKEEVLGPWVNAGIHCDINDPTGYVYLTTKRWINLIKCPTLNIPMPNLSGYDKTDCSLVYSQDGQILGEETVWPEDTEEPEETEDQDQLSEDLESLIETEAEETEETEETEEQERPSSLILLLIAALILVGGLVFFLSKRARKV